MSYQLGGTKNISVNVNNVLVNKEIHNVFGVIKGFTDPGRVNLLHALYTLELFLFLHCVTYSRDGFAFLFCNSADRYVVLGAQRDAWGNGYARAAVGTSVLIELAKAIREMVEKGNKYNTF